MKQKMYTESLGFCNGVKISFIEVDNIFDYTGHFVPII